MHTRTWKLDIYDRHTRERIKTVYVSARYPLDTTEAHIYTRRGASVEVANANSSARRTA